MSKASSSMWPAWLFISLTLLAGALAVIQVESASDLKWQCITIDPQGEVPQKDPCFRAVLTDGNLITLEWRVAKTVKSLSIYADSSPPHYNIGSVPAICDAEIAAGCSKSLRVTSGGYYRWILSAVGNSGKQYHVKASVVVPPPHAPKEVLGGGAVDIFRPEPRYITWKTDPRNDFPRNINKAWIEVHKPGSFFWDPTRHPREGPDATYQIPASLLSASGSICYMVRDCHLPAKSDTKFCSHPISVGFRSGSDYFTGTNNLHVASGEDLDVRFTTNSGNVRVLSSDSLVASNGDQPYVVTDKSSYVIDGTLLTPGYHRLELASCILPDWRCSNRVEADRAEHDGAVMHMPAGDFKKGDVIAVLISKDGHSMQTIVSPASGRVYFENDSMIFRVKKGELVAFAITAASDVLHITVDSPMLWELDREYTLDFMPAKTHSILGGGEPLDIAFDDDGGIWQINEFSNSIEHLPPSGEVETLSIPLGRHPDTKTNPGAFVKPFTLWWQAEKYGRTSISSLAERAILIGSRMWFTQGGGLELTKSPDTRNHSRIVSYDLLGSDLPNTPYDDRFCVYNVPTDDLNRLGNNQVIGLTASRGRIWIAESRGLLSDRLSAISSFVPNPENCENLLNFDDPEALAGQVMQYCVEGRTPEQDGCMEKVEIDEVPDVLKVAHLEVDPVDDSVWFSDASGKCVGKVDLNRGGKIKTFKFEDPHDDPFEGMHGLGGFPWSLKIDGSAVYTGEYATRHIIRFDKATSSYSEVFVPYSNPDVTLHSMSIDVMRDRLWFTLVNEVSVPLDTAASTIGYVDLASWRSHVDDPGRNPNITGVLYKGLETLVDTDVGLPRAHQAFRGIAVDSNSGKIALATMGRNQITVLEPRPGFWP